MVCPKRRLDVRYQGRESLEVVRLTFSWLGKSTWNPQVTAGKDYTVRGRSRPSSAGSEAGQHGGGETVHGKSYRKQKGIKRGGRSSPQWPTTSHQASPPSFTLRSKPIVSGRWSHSPDPLTSQSCVYEHMRLGAHCRCKQHRGWHSACGEAWCPKRGLWLPRRH